MTLRRLTNPLPTTMILLTCFSLAASGGEAWWAAPIAVAALGHMLMGWRLPGQPRLLFALLLAVPFALALRDLPHSHRLPMFVLTMFGYYLQALGVYQLMLSRRGGSIDQAVACAIIGLAFAGTALQNTSRLAEQAMPIVFAVFMLLLLLYLRKALRPRGAPATGLRRRVRQGVFIAGTTAFALGLHAMATHTVPMFNEWAARSLFANIRSAANLGHSRRASLGSVSSLWDSERNAEVALRVWSELPPGYMRAAVFDTYKGGAWGIDETTTELSPRGGYLGRNVFDTQRRSDVVAVATVYPAPAFADDFYLPMGVHRLASYCTRVVHSEMGTFRPRRSEQAGGYIYFSGEANPPSPGDADLQVPADLRERLQQRIAPIFDDDDTTRRKLHKIESYFRDGFEYRIGITVRPGEDPVMQFLDEIRAGHCEYFASAATLMLRAEGVPARYVTGFVAEEEGVGGHWIARRMDAHAWVEAWVPDVGWVTVEPTPPSARPLGERPTGTQAMVEAAQGYFERLLRVLTYGGPLAALAILWHGVLALINGVPAWAWAMIAVAAAGWVFRKELAAALRRQPPEHVDDAALEWREKLREAERLLAAQGLRRERWMTVGELIRQAEAADLPEPAKRRALRLLRSYQAHRFDRRRTAPDDDAAELGMPA